MLTVRANLERAWALVARRIRPGTVVVSSGRSVVPLCQHWRRQCGGKLYVIHVGEPIGEPGFADMFVASNFPAVGLRPGPADLGATTVVTIDGVLARLPKQPARRPPADPAPQVRLAVLMGGKNVTFNYDGPKFAASLAQIRRIVDRGDCSVDFVLSRRTFERTVAAIEAGFVGDGCRIVGTSDRAGFERALSEATHLVVCPDSQTMISECCSTGKPVYVVDMDQRETDTQNAFFLEAFLTLGYIRKLEDFDRAAPTRTLEDQAAKIAAPVREAILRWAGGL